MDRSELPYVVVGALAATGRTSERAIGVLGRGASIATTPAAGLWNSPLAAPLRRRTDALSESIATDGVDVAKRVRARADETVSVVMRRVGGEIADSGVIDELLDAVLSSGVVEQFVAKLLNHPGTEVLVSSTLEDPALERLIARIMDSELLESLTIKLIASDEMQMVIEYVAGAPEVRAVVAQQTAGLAGDMADGVRTRTVVADDAAERLARSLWRRRRPAGAQ